MKEKLTPDEELAYDLIVSRDGVLQSDLWKILEVDSRVGSRLATTLETKGFISREQTTHNGRVTYLLKSTNTQLSATSDTEDVPPTEDSTDEPDADLPTPIERALALVTDRGGLYQSDLWKELDVSSRTGSRIATSLEEDGLIRRQPATYNGQRTYLLLPAKKDLDFSLLMAGDMISPLVGESGEIDALNDDAFTQWVLQLRYSE